MGPVTVASLTVGDEPDAWRAAGFSVGHDGCVVGDVGIRFGADRPGVRSWTLVHPDRPPGPVDLDGLETDVVPGEGAVGTAEAAAHENGASDLDHIVVSTSDIDRTTAAFGALGVEARRTRDTKVGDAPLRQRFFRMGTIIEVIGPPEPGDEPSPARFWGLALVTEDLDRTAAVLGTRLGRVKDAVQPGRRIATLRTRELGIGVPIAFMSPHARGRDQAARRSFASKKQ